MQFRIGSRDPVTGLYYVIWPDGSQMLNGIKIFNAAYQVGDVVRATQRSDGMMILDSAKATSVAATSSNIIANSSDLRIGEFGSKPIGYLNGQVFNTSEEVRLPELIIGIAPGSFSSSQVRPGRFFVCRIILDRAQQRDLKVKIEFFGSYPSSNYGVTQLLSNNSVAIVPAGQLFFDFVITPFVAPNRQITESILIKILPSTKAYLIKVDRVKFVVIGG